MNLNEMIMKRKTKGRNNVVKINAADPNINKKTLNLPEKKLSTTFSSDINWGKSFISVPNSSNSKKTGSSKISRDEADSRVIVALTEGRGEARHEVGIAAICASMPFLILCQISDSQNYINTLTKINIFNPTEILLPNTIMDHFAGSRLIDKLKERFPNVKYIGVPRNTYNKVSGLEMLNHLCIPNLNGILLILQHRYYALAAASALLTYIQENVFIYYAGGSIKIDYQESEGYAIIDVSTADRLELVYSARPAQGNKYASLFGVLNHCQTKIGARTLRSTILQPPCKIEYITKRLSCVDELVKHPDVLSSIQVLLQKMSNIDSLLSIGTIVSSDPQKYSTRQLNYILLLNSILDIITPLKDVISKLSQPFFVQLKKILANESFTDIQTVVRQTINQNAYPSKGPAAQLQRCFAIKPGVNGLLDLVRKTYTERMSDMKGYVKSLAEKYELALTLGDNQKKGHHIVLNLNSSQRRSLKKSDLPEEFIEVHRSVGCYTMKTPELVNLSTRLDDIMKDILKISNVMVHSIIIDIRKHIYLFYTLCEEIAQLDVFQSLANASLMGGYVRPNFGGYTEITFAHHPLLDFLLPTKPVPNSIISSDDYNIHIITGPNGSGKSVFIRQVLLLQIMAQLGCYVPAQSAILKPADRIFARIYLEDNMEYGASSFVLEMKEMKYILTTMTDNSVIVIDELGRSTSLEEGTALAIAIIEKLANSSAYIYITSHFTLLTRLYDMYPNIKAWHMETISTGDDPKLFRLNYNYTIVPGVTSVRRYGVYLVRNIWPEKILNFVDGLMDEISRQHSGPNFMLLDQKSRLKYDVEATFRRLKMKNELTIDAINAVLNDYRNDLQELGYFINISTLSESGAFQNNVEDVSDYTLEDNASIIISENGMNIFEPKVLIGEPELSQGSENISQTVPGFSGFPDYGNTPHKLFSFEPFKTPFDSMNKSTEVHFPSQSVHSEQDDKLFLENLERAGFAENSNNSSSLTLYNNFSKNSSPDRQDFNAIHSPSSSIYSHKLSSVDNDRKNLSCTTEDTRTVTHENTNSESDKITPKLSNQRYKHYISPIVKVVEGLNNTTLSLKEQEDDVNKINIISDITIGGIPRGVPIVLSEKDNESSKNNTFSIRHDGNMFNSDFQNDFVRAEKSKYQSTPNTNWPALSSAEGNKDSENDISVHETKCFDNNSSKEQNSVQNEDNETGDCEIWKDCLSNSSEYIIGIEHTNYKPTNESMISKTNSSNQINCADIENNRPVGNLNESYANPGENIVVNSDSAEFNSRNILSDLKKINREGSNSSASGTDDTSTDACEQSYKVESGKTDVQVLTRSNISAKNTEIPIEGRTVNDFKEKDGRTLENELHSPNISEVRVDDDPEKDQSSSESSKNIPVSDKTSDNPASTSISSASKKRNLDQASSGSTSELAEVESKKSDAHTNGIKSQIPKKRKVSRGKFIPPRKLSAKEIRREFEEQDRKILESDSNSSNMSKYLEQIINRPTIKQIQNSTQLAVIRKSNEGVQILPAIPKKPTMRYKYSSFKAHHSNEDFNMSIFSDKNAKPFEEYLNSNERDYKRFRFNTDMMTENLTTNLNPIGIETYKFSLSRKASTEKNDGNFNFYATREQNEGTCSSVNLSQLTPFESLTPSGFYKQNKNDMTNIVNKYLHNDSFKCFKKSVETKNLFDNNSLSNEDLLL